MTTTDTTISAAAVAERFAQLTYTASVALAELVDLADTCGYTLADSGDGIRQAIKALPSPHAYPAWLEQFRHGNEYLTAAAHLEAAEDLAAAVTDPTERAIHTHDANAIRRVLASAGRRCA